MQIVGLLGERARYGGNAVAGMRTFDLKLRMCGALRLKAKRAFTLLSEAAADAFKSTPTPTHTQHTLKRRAR